MFTETTINIFDNYNALSRQYIRTRIIYIYCFNNDDRPCGTKIGSLRLNMRGLIIKGTNIRNTNKHTLVILMTGFIYKDSDISGKGEYSKVQRKHPKYVIHKRKL